MLVPVVLGLSCCISGGKAFKVIQSTVQPWVAGVSQAGAGMNYRITLVTKASSEHLSVDEVWIGKVYYKAQAVRDIPGSVPGVFGRKDTVYVYITVRANEKKIMEADGDSLKKKILLPPFPYKGKMLIGYTFHKNKKYQVVHVPDTLPMQQRP